MQLKQELKKSVCYQYSAINQGDYKNARQDVKQ